MSDELTREQALARVITDMTVGAIGGFTAAEAWRAMTTSFICILMELAAPGRQADILDNTAQAMLRQAQSLRGETRH